MKRLFKKGQRVRLKSDGRVMEVLKYIQLRSSHMVECAWFDIEKKEIRINRYQEKHLLNAL